ncbi:MAG: phospholipid carrier-dependent glycosyltransferase [Thermomicrobiales bacterium]|nr:phospholipid carrier-dependent glycosyltransferase [Thermomicrobiales bacterium]
MQFPKSNRLTTTVSGGWVGECTIARARIRRIDLTIALLIFAIGFGWYLSGVESQDYHLDESRWINRAHYLEDLADPFGPTWNHQYLTRGQPPIGSYSIGLGLVLQGQDLETNPAYDFRRSREWNQQHGTFPSHDDLMAGRRWNAFLGGVSAALLYLVVRTLTNPIGGITAAVFFLSNPLEIWYNRIALADTTLTLTLSLLYLATIHCLRRPRWWLAIAMGILIGLGGGNKFTPLALSIPLAGIGGIILLRSWWFRLRNSGIQDTLFWHLPPLSHLGWMLISTPFVALATFVASYPYLWPDPIRRTIYMLNFRQQEMDNQYRLNPRFQTDSPLESLHMTYNMLGNTWSSTLQIFQWLQLDRIGDLLSQLDLWLAIAGTLALVVIGLRKGIRSPELVIAALIVFQMVTVILSMRVAFERYYLPIMVGEFVAIGCAVGYAVAPLMGAPRDIDLHVRQAAPPVAPVAQEVIS